MSDNIITEVLDSVRQECDEDYVGLWTIPWQFRENYKISNELERQDKSLEVVRLLLKDPNIGVGEFDSDYNFHFWQESYIDAFNRITQTWQQLGREPMLGEICWFTNKNI